MVSIDNVYQKVLALANKEQRGYITPQEFNLFADQAQMEIFEQYFYDLNQFERGTGNDSTRYDVVNMLKEKTQIFNVNSFVITHGATIPEDIYQVGDCWLTPNGNPSDGEAKVVEHVDLEDVVVSQSGPLIRANDNRPIFYIHHNQVYFQPQSIENKQYRLNTIRRPVPPSWTYYIAANNDAIYNPSALDHQDFELHVSEENSLVIKILQLAGVNMKDFNLAQLAGQKEAITTQQEKQ